MSAWITVPAVIAATLGALNLKSSRPDGTLLKTHPYRRMLAFLEPTRNEAVVYFDEYIDAERLEAYIEKCRSRFHTDITHCVVAGIALGLATAPKMNRFTSGFRLYERKGRFITFSMKRKKLDREAKVSAVKMEIRPEMTFRQLCEAINGKVQIERSDKKTYVDKELALLSAIPRPALRAAVAGIRAANYYNLLPDSFIRNDPMHTSVFYANLGSLNMGAGYHHLYEWGTCPLFLMSGRVKPMPVVRKGEVVVRRMLHVRFAYDERIDDGLNARFGIDTLKHVIEDPEQWLGCLEEDGSDERPLGEPLPEDVITSHLKDDA